MSDKQDAIYVDDLYDDNVALRAENERLRAALVQIENWVGKLPSNMGEAALIFEYIEQACAVLDDDKRR